MELKYANVEELQDGWILSPKVLNEVRDFIADKFKSDEVPTLNQIESVLIAYKLTQEGDSV